MQFENESHPISLHTNVLYFNFLKENQETRQTSSEFKIWVDLDYKSERNFTFSSFCYDLLAYQIEEKVINDLVDKFLIFHDCALKRGNYLIEFNLRMDDQIAKGLEMKMNKLIKFTKRYSSKKVIVFKK